MNDMAKKIIIWFEDQSEAFAMLGMAMSAATVATIAVAILVGIVHLFMASTLLGLSAFFMLMTAIIYLVILKFP